MTGPEAAVVRVTMKARLLVPLFPSVTVASATEILASSLTIVPTPRRSAIVAPIGEVRLIFSVSLPSITVSPVTLTLISLEVSPAAKVSVPVWAI